MSANETPPDNVLPPATGPLFALDNRSPLTSERLAFLRPRLAQLLAELDLLDQVVAPSLEPTFTPREGFGEDCHAR